MIPNPWVILGALGFLLVAIAGAYFYGAHTDSLKWQAAFAKQRADGEKLLADSEAAARVKEAADRVRSDQLETDHAQTLANLAAANAHISALVARLGLFDKAGRAGGGNGVPGTGSGAAGATGGAAGCRLSDSLAQSLVALAHDADIAAAYAQACHAALMAR